jgi:hypothetical protein
VHTRHRTHDRNVLNLRIGELVEVRSAEEILATLDENGEPDGLPFMPEMLAWCGPGRRARPRRDAGAGLHPGHPDRGHSPAPRGEERYACQATELRRPAPERIPSWDACQYLQDVRSGNYPFIEGRRHKTPAQPLEKTGRMLRFKNPCIVLDDVTRTGAYHRQCPRGIYPYWREVWLERVE